MSFKLNNPPFAKKPTNLSKMSGLGPRTAFGGSKNPELISTKKKQTRKVMNDDGGDKWENRHAVKSDAQKKVEARKKEVAAMSPKELAAEQKRLNDRRKAFDKARTSSLPYIGEKLKIEKVSKNSINIPNTNSKNNTEAFMNAPYRDPNSTGPRVKRKGYHGWKKTDK